jgi:hypothetical protein
MVNFEIGKQQMAIHILSKSHASHKSVTRENFTIMLVLISILYVGATVFPPRATGAGTTLTPSCTFSVE